MRVRRFHIVGIGGAGMSAVAALLLARGDTVSGSDSGRWPLSEALAQRGATVYDTFAAEHVAGADIVIRSSAYREDNVEVRAAIEGGSTVWKRADAWRELATGKRVVAIAGTHGKSTTTAMTYEALRAGGIDASLICGAVVRGAGSNAHAGTSDVLVIEADEYDNTFLALEPLIAVVTTVDHDHIDVFPTRESYHAAFAHFVARIAPGGTLLYSSDDPGAAALAEAAARNGRVVRPYARLAAELSVPGEHNRRNAAGAVGAARLLGVAESDAVRGVRAFRGVERRLELLGTAGSIAVVDDYAHHPAEIAVGLAAYPDAVVVFQPHTPSRLDAFFEEFASVLRRARAVVVVETFRSAREQADARGRARALADAVGGRYAPDGATAARVAADIARPGDVVLVMGAGDVRPVGERVLELLGARV